MGEIKNKIVTAESLKAVHDYNEESYMKKSGGIFTNNVSIKRDEYPQFYMYDTGNNTQGKLELDGKSFFMEARNVADDDSNARRLIVSGNSDVEPKDALSFADTSDGVKKWYTVYGSHNKTSGSYTGNNDATSRIIETNGIATMVIISSDTGIALVTSRGAICMNRLTAEISGLKSYECRVENNQIIIACASEFVNSNQEYWYSVI